MRTLMLIPALLASLVLAAGCGGTSKEIWQREDRVEVQPLGKPAWSEERTLGNVTLALREPAQVTTTPSERLYLHHEEKYLAMGWDNFGLVFFGILGSIASVGLYFLFAFAVFGDSDSDNDKK
ncbi:MAG: hypothetical protein KF696_04415 [Planctomycetes bacterium]|nr:hypothetical protein [Planctomycetota bacterium]MCW8134217.1 hypothetical protein [Planctomycetota bacterium]